MTTQSLQLCMKVIFLSDSRYTINWLLSWHASVESIYSTISMSLQSTRIINHTWYIFFLCVSNRSSTQSARLLHMHTDSVHLFCMYLLHMEKATGEKKKECSYSNFHTYPQTCSQLLLTKEATRRRLQVRLSNLSDSRIT